MLRKVLHLTDRLDANALPDRGRPAPRKEAPSGGSERRLLMVGGRTARGSWTWMAPETEAARRAVPGPWDLTLLLRERPAGGSPP